MMIILWESNSRGYDSQLPLCDWSQSSSHGLPIHWIGSMDTHVAPGRSGSIVESGPRCRGAATSTTAGRPTPSTIPNARAVRRSQRRWGFIDDPTTAVLQVLTVSGSRQGGSHESGARCSRDVEHPLVPLEQKAAQRVRRLARLHAEEEPSDVLAEQLRLRAVLRPVRAVVVDRLVHQVQGDGVRLHVRVHDRAPALRELHRIVGNFLRPREAVRAEQHRQERVEVQLLDGLPAGDVLVDDPRLWLLDAAEDLGGDAELRERRVDLPVDVRLLRLVVLRAVLRIVEVAARSPRVERRVDGVLPVPRVRVLLRVLRVPVRRPRPPVRLARGYLRADHRGGNRRAAIRTLPSGRPEEHTARRQPTWIPLPFWIPWRSPGSTSC